MQTAIPHAVRNNTTQNSNLLIFIHNMKKHKEKTSITKHITGLLFSSHMSFVITTK